MANTAWEWGIEIRMSVRSHHQSTLKHILKGKGCRDTEEPAKASAGQHWTRRDNLRHILYAYCVCKPHKTFSQRHYQPSARFLEEFWSSQLGISSNWQISSVNQTLLVTAYLNSTTVTLLLLPLFFLIKDKFIVNQSASEAQLSVNTQHLS